MSGWALVFEGFDPEEEGKRESLCALGNGYFVTRGAAPECDDDGVHYPGTYVAGLYDRLPAELEGRTVEHESLVNLPNWLPLTFRIDDGEWFAPDKVELLTYRQELELHRGVLRRYLRFRDSEGRLTTLMSRCFVHKREQHLAGLELELHAENWAGRVELRAALDGRVRNSGVARYRQLPGVHLEPVAQGPVGSNGASLLVRTVQSRIEVAVAQRTCVFRGGALLESAGRVCREPGYIAQVFDCELAEGERLRLEKVVSLYTSRDRAISESLLQAEQAVTRAGHFDELLESHTHAWEVLWRRCELEIPGDEETTRLLRLHVFHLLQTASRHTLDLDIGLSPRGWTGEAYRGHIQWDELFVLPFLLLRLPLLARAILLYRYRRLPEARRAAREAGLRGAMYPWRSGSTGREETPQVQLNPCSGRWADDHTCLQRHIGSAIAYNIWRYWEVTGDEEFLLHYGAEMLLEIARFWSSLAHWSAESERYEIHGVMGPDEFHDGYPGADGKGLRNNAYTNVMAVWVLCRALEVLRYLPAWRREELCEDLGLGQEELARWEELTRRMRVCFHDEGIISQFEGYERLEALELEAYRERYDSVQRIDWILHAEGDSANRYQVTKQPDVLMLFYVLTEGDLRDLFERLGYAFDSESLERNLRYYLPRTVCGSSLSRVVHAWVLARREPRRSYELFSAALRTDVCDIQESRTREGIHLGATVGTVDLVQRRYLGLELRDGVPWLSPCLPEALSGISHRLYFRGCWLDVALTRERLSVRNDEKSLGPIRLGLGGELVELAPGQGRTLVRGA